MKKPVLVVMAAGMGSRYGGLKQLDPVGGHGQLIIDYSIYDAKRAGFETVVFVIKHAIEESFKAGIGDRLAKVMEVKYAEPFCVINADDYYGPEAFQEIYSYLCSHPDSRDSYEYAMVGYLLGNTVTEHGHVARGICEETEGHFLRAVTERTHIEKAGHDARYTEDGGVTWTALPGGTIVSMNLWGFTASFLSEAQRRFPSFLDRALAEDPMKGEYFLPSVVSALIEEGRARVRVLRSRDRWYGVTYQDDKPVVVQAVSDMTAKGLYPENLWGGER